MNINNLNIDPKKVSEILKICSETQICSENNKKLIEILESMEIEVSSFNLIHMAQIINLCKQLLEDTISNEGGDNSMYKAYFPSYDTMKLIEEKFMAIKSQ